MAQSRTLGSVAVKKMVLVHNEKSTKDFLREAKILYELNSPYIIRFFGITKTPEGEAIVMEYAANGSLYQFLDLTRKRHLESSFSWKQRLKIAQDITRGLLLMHENKILHRDMKSLNVLLGENMEAKISDFGLSQIKSKSQTTTTGLHVINNAYGSLLWKAPETFSINNPYSDKADIYALGIIFWEISTCQVPYEGNDARTIESSVLRGERLRIPSSCPSGFKRLIEECWSHDPKDRPLVNDVFDRLSDIAAQITDQEYLINDPDILTRSIPDRSLTNNNDSRNINTVNSWTGNTPDRGLTNMNDTRNINTVNPWTGNIPDRGLTNMNDTRNINTVNPWTGSIPDRGLTNIDNQILTQNPLESDIFNAASNGHLEDIINFLANGTNVNTRDSYLEF